MISKQAIGSTVTTFYDYNAQGELLRIEQVVDQAAPITVLDVTYGYDALGRRVRKNVNGVVTQYVYDGPNILHEVDGANVYRRLYTNSLGIDEPLSVRDINRSSTLYYHRDRLGSIVALTDGSGAVVQEYVYDAFGGLVFEQDPALVQPYAFTARERDLESGLYYYRNRYYDPFTGRFISEDPIGLRGGDNNIYSYVGNNPVNVTDPLGLAGCNTVGFHRCMALSPGSGCAVRWCPPPTSPTITSTTPGPTGPGTGGKSVCSCCFVVVFLIAVGLHSMRVLPMRTRLLSNAARGSGSHSSGPGPVGHALRSSLMPILLLGVPLAAYGGPDITTTYEYDELGNRTQATDLIRFTDTMVTAFQPGVAPVGSLINIFGRNLPASDGADFTVTFNGVEATILAVATTLLTVEVPEGAALGPLVVTLPDGTQVDLGLYRAYTICWIGPTAGGDGISWHDPANWDLERVPEAFDDVGILDVPETTVVEYSTGTTSINSLTCEEAFEMTGGTLMMDGHSTITGLFTWSGGSISGSGVIDADGGMLIDGVVTLRGDKTLNNNSDDPGAVLAGNVDVNMYDNAVINNTGTFDFQVDRAIDYVTGGQFNNMGTFLKSAGAGTATVDVAFDNTGTVEVQSGLLLLSRGYIQTAGETVLDGGDLESTMTLGIQGGTLCGFGTVFADVDSSGEVEPGCSAGFLELDGDYTQSGTGALNIEIGGLIAGDEYDALDVFGFTTLAGTLNIVLINSFEPQLGDSFVVLTFDTANGEFDTANGLDLGNGLILQPVYDANSLTLVVVER